MDIDTANDVATEKMDSWKRSYENALTYELRKSGFECVQQHSIPVLYEGVVVGDYVADIVVDGVIVIELKAVKNAR